MSRTCFNTFLLTDGNQVLYESGDNVSQLTVVVGTGCTLTVTGNIGFKGAPSDPITLTAGQTITLSGISGAPIDGLTLSASGGSASIVHTL